MSLQVLTQGGAGGASASIQVNGLSETDSVKAVQKINKVIENPEYKEYRVLKGQLALGDVAVGETVRLNVSGVATEFIVVNQGKPSDLYDDSCEGTWLLMKDIEQGSTWNNSNDSGNSYGSSAVHRYLNSTFLGTLDAGIQSVVIQAKIPYVNGTGSGGSVASGSNGLSAKVFLLSGYEVGFTTSDDSRFPIDGSKLSYFLSGSGTSANNKRIAYLNGRAYDWWLRSPYTAGTETVFLVDSSGMEHSSLPTPKRNRPAMILPTNLSVKDGFIDGTEVQQGKLLSSASVGDIVKMNVDGAPTEFIVVQQGKPSSLYDDSCNGTWLLMKDIHNTAMYNTFGNASYDTAMIRNSLSIFTEKLDENVLNAVKTVKIPYLEIEGAKDDIKRTLFSGADGLSTQAFLLSVYEVDSSRTGSPKDGTCLDYFKSASTIDRIASFEGTTTAWWTRTGWGTYADTQSYLVGDNGSTSTTSVKTYYGVRPAIILPGDVMIYDDGFIDGSISEPSSIETYTPLEYIESTGTQYIDVNWSGSVTDLQIDMDCQTTAITDADQAMFGNDYLAESSSNVRSYQGVVRMASKGFAVFQIDLSAIEYAGWGTSRHTFSCNDEQHQLYVDGVLQEGVIQNLNNTSVNAMYLFARENTSGVMECFWSGKCYSSTWKLKGQSIRNFIPAKRNSDSVVGLLDTVNYIFYTNAGTGDFVAGPEIPEYIEVITEGKTVIGSWTEDSDNLSYFLISPIKQYGVWTVTATNGEQTDIQDVLVDAAMDYEIKMGYILWLYREGDECEDVTGGWTSDGYYEAESIPCTPAVKNDNNIYLETLSSYNYAYACCGTVNEIDVTNYSKLYVEKMSLQYINSPYVAILPTGTKIFNGNTVASTSADTVVGEKEITFVDISSVTGYHHVITSVHSYKYHGYIYNVWLE